MVHLLSAQVVALQKILKQVATCRNPINIINPMSIGEASKKENNDPSDDISRRISEGGDHSLIGSNFRLAKPRRSLTSQSLKKKNIEKHPNCDLKKIEHISLHIKITFILSLQHRHHTTTDHHITHHCTSSHIVKHFRHMSNILTPVHNCSPPHIPKL